MLWHSAVRVLLVTICCPVIYVDELIIFSLADYISFPFFQTATFQLLQEK
jgi:hypothetical protein